MSREILFRGMAEDKSGFYYGDLYHHHSGYLQIIPKGECAKYVLQETIGKFTGLTDKNGEKAFAGDAIKVSYISLDSGNEINIKELEEERRLDAEEHACAVGLSLSLDCDFSYPYIEKGIYTIVDMGYGFILESNDCSDDVDVIFHIVEDPRFCFEIIGNIHQEEK